MEIVIYISAKIIKLPFKNETLLQFILIERLKDNVLHNSFGKIKKSPKSSFQLC